MNQSLPQEPIKWFKNGMLEQQVEWSKKEKELLVLLAQADLLFLIAQLFAPPTAHLQEMLKIEIPDIKELLESSNLPENLAEIYQQFRQQTQSLNFENWATEYKLLFEKCPIHESDFIACDKGVLLADIAELHREFGFKLSGKTQVDHLNAELEFVAMLLVKQTHSAHNASFDSAHLGKWLPTFCKRLTETSTLPIYQHLAQLLLGTWTAIFIEV
ncbi:MAG: molecular chaperone TorD family protein [Thiotrichaceae bacterium]|nr:molecular chaperone TorD family protein [Thiotrichaceae bacterium]